MLRFFWRRFLHRLRPQRASEFAKRPCKHLRRAPLDFDWLEDRINPSTTLNLLGSGLQIVIAAPATVTDTVSLDAVGGHLAISDGRAGQTITDNTGKFTVVGGIGNQTATESAALFTDFSSITITGTGGGQSVSFLGGTFVSTSVNDGTISNVNFVRSTSSFVGDLNVVAVVAQLAPITGTSAINISVGGINGPLTIGQNVISQNGPINIQTTGPLTVANGVTVVSTYGTLTLAADVTLAGAGDDGIGTLTIGDGAAVSVGPGSNGASTVTLRGADEVIAPTATVGSARFNHVTPVNLASVTSPSSIAVDASGNIYVATSTGNVAPPKPITISKITPSGVVSTIVDSGKGLLGDAIAIGPDGNLYVCSEYWSNTISVVTPAGAISTFATVSGGGVSETFDAAGNLYVLGIDVSNIGVISKITPSGVVTSAVSNVLLGGPGSILVRDSNGNFYVSENSQSKIYKVTPDGAVSLYLDSTSGISLPMGLALDANNNLYVSQIPSVLKISATGPLNWVSVYSAPNTWGQMVMDASGTLYLANTSGNQVVKFASAVGPVNSVAVKMLSSLPARPMALGNVSSAVAGINLTNAELARLTPTGNVIFGDSNQTGDITIASLAAATGVETDVFQSSAGSGQIILDDSTGIALNGNGGRVVISAGMGGIVAKNANNTAAEIATTGSVNLGSRGLLGSPTNRIQFADNSNAAQQVVSASGNGVYLDGLGSLTLGTLTSISGGPIDATARANLTVGSTFVVNNRTGPLTLAVDTTASGAGDDGVGTLTISAGAVLFGTNINLRGGDVNIDPTAVIGNGDLLPAATLSGTGSSSRMIVVDKSGTLYAGAFSSPIVSVFAGGSLSPTATLSLSSVPKALALDASGNLYVANGNVISVFAPGSTVSSANLTGAPGTSQMVFDSAGNLYAANGANIYKFTPGATTPVLTLATFSNISALAVNSAGTLYGVGSVGSFVSQYFPAASSSYSGFTFPQAMAFDSRGNLYIVSGGGTTSVTSYAPGSTNPFASYPGVNGASDLAFDASGNLFVSFATAQFVYEFVPGNTTPIATLRGAAGGGPQSIAFDPSGNLYVTDGTIRKYTFSGLRSSNVSIRSSIPSRPMSIGGTNNSVVAGINLTSAELATIVTAPNGTITYGDSSQTGAITFHTATPATTPGASTVAMESASGAAAIFLDDGVGTASALNGNGGAVNLTAGTGGIQGLSPANSIPEISNSPSVSLTTSGGIGTANPIGLATITNLATDTSTNNSSQALTMLGPGTSGNLNAGTGAVSLAGNAGFSTLSSVAGTLTACGTLGAALTVGNGEALTGSGSLGAVTVQSGGSIGATGVVSTLTNASLAMQAGATFNVAINGPSSYTRDSVLAGGTVNLGGATLSVSGNAPLANGQTLTVINNFGSQPIAGTFSGMPEGFVFTNFLGSGLNATLSYVGGDGNDVVITVGSGTVTATALTSATPSAVYGQSITFTAVVSTASSTPTGSVEFYDGTTGADLGAGTLQSTAGTSATWTYVAPPGQIKVTAAADAVEATFSSLNGFFGSAGMLAGGQVVTPRTVTVTGATPNNKVYDHTNAALFNTTGAALVGVLSGDVVTLAGTGGLFASVNVGNGITVTASFKLGGADTRNYALTEPTGTANITPAPLTATGISASNKVYDGTTTATISTIAAALSGIFTGDSVTLNFSGATGTFSNKFANPGGTVITVLGLTISGPQASDYVLAQATTWATISPKPLTVSGVTASDKIYDGTTTATLNTTNAALVGVVNGDNVTLNKNFAKGTFVSKNAGSNLPVSTTGFVLNGTISSYVLSQPTVTANITKAALTITAVTNTKVFDGATTAAAIPIVTGLVGTDTVTGLAETYDTAAVGTNKTLSVSAYTINDGNGGGNYAVTTVPNQTGAIVAPAFSGYAVTVVGPVSFAAGSSFLFTVQAVDQGGNPFTSYSGPASVALAAGPPDPQGSMPASGALNSAGFGFFVGTLKTAGTYTLTASAGGFTGASNTITVTPASASYFTVTAPASASTGTAVNVTVKAYDQYGNVATGYAGHVHFTSTDAAAVLPADPTLTSGAGVFPVTLKTAGTQTITAKDTVSTAPTITGTSSAVTTRGLTVSSLTPTATGFTVAFSKPFDPAKLTMYGVGSTVQDVTLSGAANGSVSGTLIIDASNTSATFKASAIPLNFFNTVVNNGPASVVLPDDTYTVTLKSGTGTNGFFDALGAALDGANNAGHANFATTFTTHYQANKTPVLAIPDFARGPDDGQMVKVPNNTGHGIPVTLYNAVGLTDAAFTISFDPALLTNINGLGGAGSDASDPGSSFALVPTPGVVGQATFTFHDATPQSGSFVLGDILANVPSTAKTNYKAKELIQFVSANVNGAAFAGVTAPGVHVNAYFGDVSSDGQIGAADVNPMFNVAVGTATGFAPYSLLDPAIVGDVVGDVSVDGGDVATLKSFILHFPRPVIPTPPGLTGIVSPSAADPTLSLAVSPLTPSPSPPSTGERGVNVAVLLDDPHPAGSTGLTEAVLALHYDPATLSVSAADITLGSLTSGGSWQLRAVVDQLTGEIGIEIWSETPIKSTDAGSLVNIAFHVAAGAKAPAEVRLVDKATPRGVSFVTTLADSLGSLSLSPGVDRIVVPLA